MRLARLSRAAPALLLALALALAHGEIWRAGPSRFAPLTPIGVEDPFPAFSAADVTFESWLAARNARTLLTRPWRLFDTEHCAPEEHSITYGVPLVGLGVLALPAALWTREPVLVYNAALLAWSASAALAMYLLVTSWTGRRAAGLAAALLFAFHGIRLDHILHPSEWDISWTLFALYFAERLFAHGRWRDAVGLGLSGAMQVATSFYTLFAATLLALPLGAWLLLRRPLRVRPAQLGLALGCVALTAALLFSPYYAARNASRIGDRSLFFYASWSDYAPDGPLFFGWPLLLLAALGLAAPRRRALARLEGDPRRLGDPRPALLAGALLAAFVAAGPTTAELLSRLGLPSEAFDPHAWLARWVPGLDAVRAVARFASGTHAMACVLAGAGVAALQSLAGRHARSAGALAVALALLAVFGAPLPHPTRWRLHEVRPSQATIDFYVGLGSGGERGPLFEVPVDFQGDFGGAGPDRILLSAWHGRRTSACFGSYVPPSRAELNRLANLLPQHRAIQKLHELGFTTVVVNQPKSPVDPVDVFTRRRHRHRWLELIGRNETLSAYALHVGPDE